MSLCLVLTACTSGNGTWFPNASQPATVVIEVDSEQGRILFEHAVESYGDRKERRQETAEWYQNPMNHGHPLPDRLSRAPFRSGEWIENRWQTVLAVRDNDVIYLRFTGQPDAVATLQIRINGQITRAGPLVFGPGASIGLSIVPERELKTIRQRRFGLR